MGEPENFEKLINERPADALKYAEGFKKNVFWKYYLSKLEKELAACDVMLRECSLDKVLTVRGYYKGIKYKSKIVERVISDLKDEIVLQKEAEKIEAARQPEDQ